MFIFVTFCSNCFPCSSVLDCDPHLDDTKELIHELNRTNGLFKFVRTMREKFQEAVAHGIALISCIFLAVS